jgi:hypothetical protein
MLPRILRDNSLELRLERLAVRDVWAGPIILFVRKTLGQIYPFAEELGAFSDEIITTAPVTCRECMSLWDFLPRRKHAGGNKQVWGWRG